jgi:hypothetical protein
MAQFIKVGTNIINLARVTHVLYGDGWAKVCFGEVYYDEGIGGEAGDFVEFDGNEADALRKYLTGICVADVML